MIAKPEKKPIVFSVISYLLILATTALAILETGEINSPFFGLWMVLSTFSVIFGAMGWLVILFATGGFIAIQYLDGKLDTFTLIAIALYNLVPIIIGAILWRKQSNKPKSETNLKHLSSTLNEVASKSEVVINAIGDGVIAIDSQGVIQLINPAAQKIVGWSKQDATNLNYKSVLKLMDNQDKELTQVNDPVQQSLNTNQQIRTSNLSLMTKSGKKLLIYIVVSPVGQAGSGVIIVFRDITKEKTEERQQAEFISTASHEMRTPVASIEGYLGLAINPETATIDNRAKEYINKAHEAAQHLGRLFQDLLDISKADDGRITNNPKVVNLVPFIHDIVVGLNPKAVQKGLSLTYKPMPTDAGERFIAPEFLVNLDNDHIREVVSNLVDNAIKYTPKGEIIVDVSGDNNHVIISVKDSGIGIPAEDMPHLFQKFYRVDNKDTREIGGTGLGLYLSRRLTEIMGGRIWADSVYTKGSTFYVELPRISSQEAELGIKSGLDLNSSKELEPAPPMTQTPPTPAPTPIQIPVTQPADSAPSPKPQEPNNVPRGQALTPEQIASYVAKQRALAQEQANNIPNNQGQA